MPSIGDLCASMLQPVIKAKAMPKEPNKNEVHMIETPMIETPRSPRPSVSTRMRATMRMMYLRKTGRWNRRLPNPRMLLMR